MALVGVAGADSLTLTNNTSENVITTEISDDSAYWVDDSITLTDNAIIDILAQGTNKYGGTSMTGYAIGNTNVGNGGSYVYSVSFTVANDAPAITLTEIAAGFTLSSATADSTQTGRCATYNWQFLAGSETLVDYAGTDYWSEDTESASTGVLTMNFGDGGTQLIAGETYTLNIKVTGVNNEKGTVDTNGGFVHIGTITATASIPEPTTATLSLLALAGLASRRRRR